MYKTIRPSVTRYFLAWQICLLNLAPFFVADSFASTEDAAVHDRKQGTIVILGASYAKAWPIETINGGSVVNQGIGGNQSFEMLSRFENDVISLGPESVILWGFINDFFRSEASEHDAAKAKIMKSYEQMHSIAESHDVRVIIATEITLREPSGIVNWLASIVGRALGKTSYQEAINRQVHEVNNRLRSYAKSHDLALLDFEKALANSSGQRRSGYAADDGSHVTAEAYETLTEYTGTVLGHDAIRINSLNTSSED